MKYCRTTLISYRSEQDADELISTYQANAAADFPDAELLLCTRTGPTSAVMTSLYSTKNAADQAMAARKPILQTAKGESKIKRIETHQGEAFKLD
ncbi:MAG: hypothetical protein HKN85_04975 [Gammaproteobacteria bacterium]|nr:hypothetical protein [Gammaproteobacteria bacterium]